MPKSFSAELGAWKASVERRLDNLASGNRLDHASLDGTTLYLKGDGELGRIGRQPDGSNGVHIAKVQPPPQLTAPILTVGEQAGTCLVEWDGQTFDGRRMPLIHGHTEIWAELVDADWSPTVAPGDTAKRVGTIRDRTGGEVVVALPQAGTWAVWLRAMGADRETAGPWSPVSQVDIKPLVDTEAIEAELEDARDRLEQAEQDLAAGMADRVAEIEYLRETRIPALQDALNTGLDDVYRDAQAYAEAQADDAVNRAAADAQSEYDRLQEIAERALSRAGDNVLEDPSFETNYWPNNLFLSSFNAATSTLARTGDQAMAITRATSSTTGVNMTFDTVDVEPDDSWRFSIWYRTVDGDTANLDQGVGTRIRIRDGSNNILASSTTFEPGEEYSRAVVTFTVPSEGVASLRPTMIVSHTEGTLIVDDVSFQEVGAAAEALRLAEVARQQAEAAHVAAGNAVDTAANAYDAASSKSSVHWSLSAPSGTADSTDDVWWQYELRNGRRVVIGQWFWDNGVWRETEIAEEWLPLVNIGTGTYGDLSGDRLEANTVKAGALAVMPDTVDFAPDPSEHEELWDLLGATLISNSASDNPSGLRFSFGRGTGTTQIRGPMRPVTQGQTIYFSARYGWTFRSSANVQIRMEWYATPEMTISNRLSFSTFVTIPAGSDAGIYEGTVTVPDGAAYANLYMYQVSGSGGNDAINGTIHCEPQTPGVLIQDGAVNSQKVNTEEFFAAQAVIDKVWTDIVRSRLIQSEGIITEDMIATGAITTPKLTVTEEMVAEVARLLRIEAGSLASNDIEAMRIVSSLIEATTYLIHDADGEVSVRLDGVANYIAGRLRAGMAEGSSISLDYGEKVRFSGLNEEGEPDPQRVINTPYMNFHTTDVTYQENQEPSIHLERDSATGERDGMMVINPGYPVGTDAFRGTLNVVGDVLGNRMVPRERLQINTSHPDQPGVIQSSGQGLRIRGQIPSSSHSQEMFYVGQTDLATLAAGGRRKRTLSWGVPVPRGRRDPIGTVYLQGASSNNNARVEMNISQRTTTSYRLDEYNNSSADAGYWVGIIAPWRDV